MTINEFVTFLNQKFGNGMFSTTVGKKYTRVVQSSGGSRSVYCFIDADGNIYKPAGWKTPAKGIRSTLETVTDQIDQYGSWLYR